MLRRPVRLLFVVPTRFATRWALGLKTPSAWKYWKESNWLGIVFSSQQPGRAGRNTTISDRIAKLAVVVAMFSAMAMADVQCYDYGGCSVQWLLRMSSAMAMEDVQCHGFDACSMTSLCRTTSAEAMVDAQYHGYGRCSVPWLWWM